MTFRLLDPTPSPEGAQPRPEALAQRRARPLFRDLAASAHLFQPSEALVEAVNVALALSQPLLLAGEPGTGKTQVAHYLRWYFGLPEDNLFRLDVKSTSTAADLTVSFDAVSYFRAANDPQATPEEKKKAHHLVPGPLWKAYDARGPALVLIDEIDKAPRDFPNDLLSELDQHEIVSPVTGEKKLAPNPPPLVVITSNSERRLPEPFLRRCVFHFIEFDEALVRKAVEVHLAATETPLDASLREAALKQFWALRDLPLRKKPATGELLAWLGVLAALPPAQTRGLASLPAEALPAVGVLIKDSDDLKQLKLS